MAVLERLIDFAVGEKNPATLERIVRFINGFVTENSPPEDVRNFSDQMLARAGSPALVSSFLEALTGADARANEVIAYATAIGPGSVDALVRSLHHADDPALHRKLCDALIAVAGDSIAAVLDRLDVDHPEVAVDAVYIAKAIKLETLTPHLRELVFYPDARVKLEMLQWIALRDDTDSTELLLSSLNDLDKRVRLMVLETLCRRRSPLVRERLSEIAFGKDLGELSSDEQHAIFKALGHVADAQTVVQLRAMVEKRRLLSLGKGPDAKHLAVCALEQMQDPAALELLAKLATDSNEAIRERARRAKEALAAAPARTPAGSTAKAGQKS
jgi:HEAT repeat protein